MEREKEKKADANDVYTEMLMHPPEKEQQQQEQQKEHWCLPP